MEKCLKQVYWIILVGVVCCALGYRNIEVATAQEFNVTKDIEVRIWNNDLPIQSNGLMYIKVGTRSLELNCSIPDNGQNYNNVMLSWKQGQKWLDKSSQLLLDNKTLQLKINQEITWDQNGSVYWCGPHHDLDLFVNIKGSQVTIIAGDPPRPPTDLKHNIVGLLSFEINIYWKAKDYTTGGLPAHYDVMYTPCSNITYCQGRYQFCKVQHIPGKTDYKCSKLRENMKTLDYLHDLSWVTIATVNPLGQSESPKFYISADFGGVNSTLYPTPRPPCNLEVSSLSSDSITIVWQARKSWERISLATKYTVFYHKYGDHTNKTQMIHGQTSLTLRNINNRKKIIEAYTRYIIYVAVQFIEHNNIPGSFSDPLGPIEVRTLEGIPEPGPDIQDNFSTVYPHNPSKRNITISWEVPPLSKWHGYPLNIKVHYGDDHKKVISTSDNIPSQVILSGLDSNVSYMASLALCNNKTCGSYGFQKKIDAVNAFIEPVYQDTTTNTNKIVVIAVITIGSLAFIILFLVLAWYCCCRRYSITKDNHLSLSERVGNLEPAYVDRYESPDNLSHKEYVLWNMNGMVNQEDFSVV